MARKTLRKDWTTFTQDEFRIENNVWNKGELVNGKDYKQTISYNPADVTTNLKFAWDWPDTDHILAYPELQAGYKPWSQAGSAEMITRVSQLKTMDVSFDYDISGETNNFNVGFDIWLTKKPEARSNSITTEVSVWTHVGDIDPDGKNIGNYRDGDFRGQIWVDNDYGHAGSNQTWRYITVRSDSDLTDGTVDLDHLLETLIDKKLVKSSDYFNGYEFGAQLTGGKGELLIHDLEHEFAAGAKHAGASELHAAGADEFWF